LDDGCGVRQKKFEEVEKVEEVERKSRRGREMKLGTQIYS
jgi:hypothetical protein